MDFLNIKEIISDHYVRLLASIVSNPFSMGILVSSEDILWHAKRGQIEPLPKLLSMIGFCPDPASLNLQTTYTDLDSYQVFSICLSLDYVEKDTFLVCIISVEKPESAVPEPVAELFPVIADLLSNEINLNTENENIALELSQRYEELNLIYQSDERSQGEAGIQRRLGNVLDDIGAFMSVEAAFMWLFDIGQFICSTHEPVESNLLESMLREAISSQAKRLSSIDQGIVLNAQPKVPFRMILSPLKNTDNQLTGVLGCIRKAAAEEFGTSDRKLVDVIAQRVAKIIANELDSLTGLVNRAGLEAKLEELLSLPAWNRKRIDIAFIDIDRFRLLNDAYGLEAGDSVLKETGRALSSCLRDGDFLSRTEGDQFVVILSNPGSDDQSREILERIRNTIAGRKFSVGQTYISFTVRIGLVRLTRNVHAVSELFLKGEIALETARERGGNCLSFFQEADQRYDERQIQAQYATRIETLVEKQQFLLFSQPIIPLRGGPMHYELLIRLKDDDGSIVPPFRFLPAAERYGKMPFIDRWVIEEACRSLREKSSLLKDRNISWAINLSGQSLQDESFLKFLLPLLSAWELPRSWLNFEITETVAIQNFTRVIQVIEKIQAFGFSVSLDDFGTGYSSFEYLKKLPVSYLKIDGTFVRKMHEDHFDRVTVQSIVAIARSLDLKTIAEFVENQEIVNLLVDLGVDYAQGYHTGKPLDFQETLLKLDDQATGTAAP